VEEASLPDLRVTSGEAKKSLRRLCEFSAASADTLFDVNNNERRGMRILLLTAVACAAALSTSVTATRAAGCGNGVGPIKYSTVETIKGKYVVVNCGPAKATMHYKGKTYTFKNGTCFRYLGAFKLNLGDSLLVPTPGHNPFPNLTINASPSGQLEVGMGVGAIAIYAATKSSGPGIKGTFTSITNGIAFTGSWNCGGPVRKS
jgi:hypothetical protein